MEVVAGEHKVELPFQRRNVVEWSHRDSLTGALERARRETNHWSASNAGAIHNYNKVVDHRALNGPDGRVQQTQRKQMEVFSTEVPGGSLQVFRSSTTSSSRSSFQFTQMGSGSWGALPDVDTAFGDLKLSLHPLDLSSEKAKASVGRSIGWRRPPTRVTRAAASAAADQDAAKETRVDITVEDDKETKDPVITFPSDDDSSEASVRASSSRHSIIESRKSCSSENLVKVGVDSDALSVDSATNSAANGSVDGGLLGRSSVLRRSLQYTRPPDFPTATGTSVRRMREEIEARGGAAGAGPGAGPGSGQGASSPRPASPSSLPKEQTLDKVKRIVSDSIATQNHSFVTVKSLNEVRGRLRSKAVADTDATPAAAPADTLVSEDHVLRRGPAKDSPSQSYVFGMEKKSPAEDGVKGKLVVNGVVNGDVNAVLNGVRSEEWYRRRKSYGFEQQAATDLLLTSPNQEQLISPQESRGDSWSDSGSFKSAMSFSVSPLLKHIDAIKRSKDVSKDVSKDSSQDTVNGVARRSIYDSPRGKLEGGLFLNNKETNGFSSMRSADEATIAAKKTVVSLVNEDADKASSDMDRRRDVLRRRAERDLAKQGVSVSVPVVADDTITVRAADVGSTTAGDVGSNTRESALLMNGFAATTTTEEAKRHSIAVVETSRNSHDDGDDDIDNDEGKVHLQDVRGLRDKHHVDAYLSDSAEDASHARKKRVEFSKTEVHFAAEPGRFNLVSTDDKPPPTNIVRGRRRQRLLAEQNINKSGLPEVRFGDYEKQILCQDGTKAEAQSEEGHRPAAGPAGAVITVTMGGKLSPDHPAGERPVSSRLTTTDEDEKSSGVFVSTVKTSTEAENTNTVPMWRSTVTLKSNSFANPSVKVNEHRSEGEAEFQKLLKSLRPTGKRDISSADAVSDITVTTSLSPTIRSKGFSTKVNLCSSETNGVTSHTGAFVPPLIRESSELKPTTLHSLKLSRLERLGLESTQLVLLANSRPRRAGGRAGGRAGCRAGGRARGPLSLAVPLLTDDDELSDDSLQADAEVRAYMLAHLGPSPASRTSYSPTAEVPSPLQDHKDHQDEHQEHHVDLRYRHHASKAERLMQLNELSLARAARTASPNSVYLVPEQRPSGLTALRDFRTPTPVLPKSFSLVDSVARRTDKVDMADAATQVSRDASSREASDTEIRTVSVRDILNRLSVDRNDEPARERIIDVVNAASTDRAGDKDAAHCSNCRKTNPDPERASVRSATPTTDSVIFKDYRPTSPRDLNLSLSTTKRGIIDREVIDRGVIDRGVIDRGVIDRGVIDRGVIDRGVIDRGVIDRGVIDRGVIDRGVIDRGVIDRGVIDRGVIERSLNTTTTTAATGKEIHTSRHRSSAPRTPPADDVAVDDELSKARRIRRGSPLVAAADTQAREFLHSRAQPGGHHIDVVEKFLRSERSHHEDQPALRGQRNRECSQSRDGRSREADPRRGLDDHQLDRAGEERRRRSRSRDELAGREDHRRRSRSRDDLHADVQRNNRDVRSRSRSQDELLDDDRHRQRNSRTRDDLEQRHHQRSREEKRHRSRSRDALEISNQARHRSRSRDALEISNQARHRSRSREAFEISNQARHRSRSREAFEISNQARHRSRSRDAFEISNLLTGADPVGQRSRSREGGVEQRKGGHQESGRSSRCREEMLAGLNGDERKTAGSEDASRHTADQRSSDVKASDRKRPEVASLGKEKAPEASSRRHRCKCAERGDAARTTAEAARDAKLRSADKGSRTHAAERAARGVSGAVDTSCLRRTKGEKGEKGEKLVRKTRTHVAAIASPIAHLVKPSKDRRQNDTKKSGDIHIVIEPIRPVRRSVPVKQTSTPVANMKGLAKVTAQKRPSGTGSDSNSSLSQMRTTNSHPVSTSELQREKPARRNHRKATTISDS